MNKQMERERLRQWRLNNPDRVKLHSKKDYESRKEQKKEYSLKRRLMSDKLCPFCKINNVGVQNTYCSLRCAADARTKKILSEIANGRVKCFKCKKIKSPSDFYKNKGNKTGFDKRCKECKKNPEEQARYILNLEIRCNRIIKPTECSKCHTTSKKIQGHHEDYSKPLEVIWLCSQCHSDLHLEKTGGKRK